MDPKIHVVRAFFEARSRGREAVLEVVSSDIQWQVRADLPDSTTYVGHAGVRELQARFADIMDDIWLDPQDFIVAHGRVVVPLHWGGRGRTSGINFEERHETWVFSVQGDLVTAIEEYSSLDVALDVLGDQD